MAVETKPERKTTRTSIEKVRRRDLVQAAYETFVEYGMGGTTVARISERLGMSHGIVNYYFKTKKELLIGVVRYANRIIMDDVVGLLAQAHTPRQRVEAIIAGNFPKRAFNRATANAWLSFCAAVPGDPEFERLLKLVYRRQRSNLVHALAQMMPRDEAVGIAKAISVMIDGLWMQRGIHHEAIETAQAIRLINDYVSHRLDGRPSRVSRPE